MSFSSIRDLVRKRRKTRVTSHNAKERYLGKPERGAIKKEVVAKNFRTSRVGFHPLRKNDKEEGRLDMSFSGIRDPARKRKKPRVTSHNAKEQYLREPEQGAIKKEIATKNFRTSRVGFHPLRKNEKEEGRPKVEP